MNIENMLHAVNEYFGKSAEQAAKDTNFVRRESKINGTFFLKTLVFGFLNNTLSSLNDLTEFCKKQFGVKISAQGLDERINEFSLKFMEKMFKLALEKFFHKVKLPIEILQQFTSVNITDSTAVSLPEKLAGEFPGCGGSASKAALKIQLVLDFLTGSFQKVTLTDGITPDQKYKEHIDVVKPNSLNMFDLGYFTLNHLKAIMDKQAYFLCRLLLQTDLYDEAGNKVNLLSLLRAESRNSFELCLFIGKKMLLPIRVLFFKVPQEITEIRRRNAKKEASKKGRMPSKISLELMGWTILITNAPIALLSIEHAGLFYSVRWQIELIFKLWKSHMKLDCISGYRKERILVQLYAKLIGLVLFQFVSMPVWQKDINISPVKSFKRFKEHIKEFVGTIDLLEALKEVVEEIHSAMMEFAKREKRKKRLTTSQQLVLGVDYFLA